MASKTNHTEPLVVRVDAGTKNKAMFAARADGVSVAEWIRGLIKAELRERRVETLRAGAAEWSGRR